MIDLPIEIQQKVLENLDDQSIIKIKNVCRTWDDIIERIIKRRCTDKISADVIQELNPHICLRDLKDSGHIDWHSTFKRWLNGSPPPQSRPNNKSVIETISMISSYLVTGDLIIVAHSAKVELYNSFGAFLQTIYNGDQSVLCDIKVMNTTPKDVHRIKIGEEYYVLEGDVLLLSGTERISMCSLSVLDHFKVLWNFSYQAARYSSGISVCSLQFCIQETGCRLVVNEVYRSNSDVVVRRVFAIECASQVWKWKIWNKEIYCVLATGQLAVWGMETQMWLSVSDRLWELMYQNPSVMYRGLYVCNSRTSQSLLEYWHCLSGDPYWLISTDGVHFDRYFPIRDTNIHADVSAICIKRRLILTATNTGSVYMFRYDGQDRDIGSFWSQEPSLVVEKFSERPLLSLDVGFDGSHFVLAGKVSGRELVIGQWSKST